MKMKMVCKDCGKEFFIEANANPLFMMKSISDLISHKAMHNQKISYDDLLKHLGAGLGYDVEIEAGVQF